LRAEGFEIAGVAGADPLRHFPKTGIAAGKVSQETSLPSQLLLDNPLPQPLLERQRGRRLRLEALLLRTVADQRQEQTGRVVATVADNDRSSNLQKLRINRIRNHRMGVADNHNRHVLKRHAGGRLAFRLDDRLAKVKANEDGSRRKLKNSARRHPRSSFPADRASRSSDPTGESSSPPAP
jgi:hypothetical protein